MSEQNQNNKLPIGLLLQRAGLISPEELQNALDIQAQYTQMKLGEILVLQQGIREKTIDFFVDKWQEIIAQGQIFPLGYYLRKAYLLNEKQVEIILQEQKSNQEKFGAVAVQKGWVKQDTIDFFLNNLSSKPPQLMTLRTLEEYNKSTLHLEKKYADHYLLLSRILAWTGGIPNLTKTICQVFAKSTSNIPGGREINAVDQFIEGTLIRKWQTSKLAASIRAIRRSLLDNPRCDSSLLLKEYQDILLSGSKQYLDSKEQKELLLLGLIVQENDQVKVSNILYQQIFDQEFIIDQLNQIQPETIQSENGEAIASEVDYDDNSMIRATNPIAEYSPQGLAQTETPTFNQEDVEVKAYATKIEDDSSDQAVATPEPLTRIGSIITGIAIALLIPLFLTINNYYSSLPKPVSSPSSSAKKISELQQLCSELIFTDTTSSLNLISQLEENQQQLLVDFPENCETALDQLRVTVAPLLGKENRILEAIRHLCKVPAGSEMYIDAEVWLKRWYDSPAWGEETKFYLQHNAEYDNKGCPAAHFAEYDS